MQCLLPGGNLLNNYHVKFPETWRKIWKKKTLVKCRLYTSNFNFVWKEYCHLSFPVNLQNSSQQLFCWIAQSRCSSEYHLELEGFNQVVKLDEKWLFKDVIAIDLIMNTLFYSLGYVGWWTWDIFYYLNSKRT